jgi:hypothetical protein
MLRRLAMAAARSGYVALTLERGSGELVARGTWTNSSGGATEATTVDVFHTPPPA